MSKFLSTIIGSFMLSLSLVAQAGDMQQLRGQRYCEILISQRITKEIKVYNTIGLNQCPVAIWNKITPERIKKETGAAFVHLNGPRYWTIDGLQNSSLVNTNTRMLGDLAMREAGVLELSLRDILNAKPYHKHRVQRQTTCVYDAGKPVYEITNQQGETFVMQSFSTQKIPQTQQSLALLGTKLNLPPGWVFRSRLLPNNAYLTAENNEAVVIQDDFLNTYQQENSSFKSK